MDISASSRSPGVAVIVPTRDRRERVLRAVESVLAQTVPAAELVVVDDGSTDGTGEWLEERCGKRVRVLRQAPSGVSAARNRGVRATRSPWLAFLDSDDEWRPTKLERQLETLRAAPARLCHCDEVWIRNGNQVLQRRCHRKRGGDLFGDCLERCVISPSAVLLERALFEEAGGFDESLPACEDYDLWLRICCRERVAFTDEALVVKHGGHEDQLSRTVPALDRFRIRALEKLLDTAVLHDQDRRAAELTLVRRARIYLEGCRRRGRDREADAVCVRLEERFRAASGSPGADLPALAARR